MILKSQTAAHLIQVALQVSTFRTFDNRHTIVCIYKATTVLYFDIEFAPYTQIHSNGVNWIVSNEIQLHSQ